MPRAHSAGPLFSLDRPDHRGCGRVLDTWQKIDVDQRTRGAKAERYLRATLRVLGLTQNQVNSWMGRLPERSAANTQRLLASGYADFFVQFCKVGPSLSETFGELFRVYTRFYRSANKAGRLTARTLSEVAFARERP